jgi:hypothetical protein
VDYLLQVVLGIVAGILTTAVLFFLRDLWRKTIQPWIEEVRYKGVRVAGTWRGVSHEEHFHSEAILFLKQSASNLVGTFTFKWESPARNFILEYEVAGYVWEGYLTLNFRPQDRGITTSAVALLKIAGGGHSLAGQFCFRNVELEAVTPVYITLGKHLGPGAQAMPLVAPPPGQALAPAQAPAPAQGPAPAPVAPQGEAPQ